MINKLFSLFICLLCLFSLPTASANSWATPVENLHYAQTGQPGMSFNIQEQHGVPHKATVLMVQVLDKHHRATPQAEEFHPYEGALARAPYLGTLALICAWLLPFGMLLITLITVVDYRKQRCDNPMLMT